MSLVKCPECGKKNVSDKAEMCPNCGYNIKEHFDKIQEQEFGEDYNTENDYELEEWEKQWRDNALKEIKMPLPPKPIDFILPFSICLALGIMCFLLPEPVNVIGFIFFLIVGICLGIYFVNSADKKYQQAINDFEEYKQQVVNEEIEKIQHEIMEQQIAESIQLHCPYCNSTDISKIGVVNRAVSVGTLGLASNKIGKQWHCNKCKSNF